MGAKSAAWEALRGRDAEVGRQLCNGRKVDDLISLRMRNEDGKKADSERKRLRSGGQGACAVTHRIQRLARPRGRRGRHRAFVGAAAHQRRAASSSAVPTAWHTRPCRPQRKEALANQRRGEAGGRESWSQASAPHDRLSPPGCPDPPPPPSRSRAPAPGGVIPPAPPPRPPPAPPWDPSWQPATACR